MKPLISVIIPTYKRTKFLVKLLNNLIINNMNFKNFEIIICDSDKTKTNFLIISKIINNFKNVKIKYINILENNHSKKRNTGIINASSNLLIFLDDDCLPEKKFISKYYKILTREKDKAIFCGSVTYPNNQSSFGRYRESRHFQISDKTLVSREIVKPEKIVTMNMAFNLSKINKKYLFNENFNFYGFEDYDFAFNQVKSDIKIYRCSPTVAHYDLRTYEKYLHKIIFIGNEGMKHLIRLNYDASRKINYMLLEENFIIKNMLKIKYSFLLFKSLVNLTIYIEKKIVSFPMIIKMGIVFAYLTGCLLRKDVNKKHKFNNNNWYV